MERASTAYQTQRDARVELQERRQRLREIAVLLDDELIALRRVLKKVLGTRHHDFQYLRVSRMRREDFAAHEAQHTPDSDVSAPGDATDASGTPQGA
jgi:hypothetical protein